MTSINKLLEIMADLRNPQSGCPWDLQQDFATVAPYTIEEAYEVADAIARDDMNGLQDELGDLLLQVVFHAQMAAEAGHFGFDDVVGSISDKLLRRHPHVFGSIEERAAGLEAGSWERLKADERTHKDDASALSGVAQALPALKRSQKLGERAARSGFDWPDTAGVFAKIGEELQELEDVLTDAERYRVAEELGDILFSVVNLARHLDVDAEHALTLANRKFEARFREMEELVAASGKKIEDMPSDALEAMWQTAKRRLDG